MKIKTIISMLFILVVTILYFFGVCDWDLPMYLLCVGVAALFMFVFIRQQKRYDRLHEGLDKELQKHKTMTD